MSKGAHNLERTAKRTLLLTVIGTPLLFLFALGVNYALVPHICEAGASGLWLLIVSVIAIGMAALAVREALSTWRAAGQGLRADGADYVNQARFIGMLGVLVSALMLLLLLAQAIPMFILRPCAGA